MARFLLASFSLSLAACSQTMEERVADAAERINAQRLPNVESARAEGRKLIIRFAMPSSRLTNDEIVRLTTAGACNLNAVRELVREGGSIRVESGGDFGGASADVDRCPNA